MGWSRLRHRTLAVTKNCAKMTFFSRGKKKLPKKNIFFLHISCSYAKILSETNFHAREFPRSGWKAEGGEEEKNKKKKKKVCENNGQLCFVRHHGWRTQARLDQFNSYVYANAQQDCQYFNLHFSVSLPQTLGQVLGGMLILILIQNLYGSEKTKEEIEMKIMASLFRP